MAVNDNDLAGGSLPRGVRSLSIPTHKNLKGPKFYRQLPLPKGGAASFIPGMGDYGPAGWSAQGWGFGNGGRGMELFLPRTNYRPLQMVR